MMRTAMENTLVIAFTQSVRVKVILLSRILNFFDYENINNYCMVFAKTNL
jgi:hypothetical protein